MLGKWIVASLAALSAVASAVPAVSTKQEYIYRMGDRAVKRPYTHKPINIGGIPIGTTELDESAVQDSPSVTKGHHIGHKGWVITKKTPDDRHWEYRPPKNSTHTTSKRQVEEITFVDFLITTPAQQTHVFGDLTLPSITDINYADEFSITDAIDVGWNIEDAISGTLDFFIESDGGDVAVAELADLLDGVFTVGFELLDFVF
ncbi:hypothetical protein NA57DRAFT_78842 [Rhizodiscina lignyota]|uniref:Uncharacterized protein n=1 Tax=Rhizodiscina lignyota TaxID=1504668 RepID=A0A9P4M3T8_9PEZI|nr:hypothetical protein NA57DRAFT_78842 [Rhizodiscina lignyota]